MVLSQSERISQLLDNSRKYVSRNKVRDSSELHLIHQAKASSFTVPSIVKGTADPHTSQIVPNYQYASDCPAVTYYTGVGTNDHTAILQNKQKCAICADDDPSTNPYIILPVPSCANIIPNVKPDYGGSLYFNNNSRSYLEIDASTDFTVASGEDFTIEWFQYALDTSGVSHVFSVGPLIDLLGFSIEYDISIYPDYHVYLWAYNANDTIAYLRSSIDRSSIFNKWVHIAVDRYGSRTTIFINGVTLVADDVAYTVNDTYNLRIGQLEDTTDDHDAFNGYITNFRWTKSISVYESTDFTVPKKPLVALTNSVLLLSVTNYNNATKDTAGLENAVSNNNDVVYNGRSPFK